MVDRVACFLTCGYSESGEMQAFLKKINGKYDFKQFLPNKTIKKRGMQKTIQKEISGLTGQKLLERIYAILEMKSIRDEVGQCKAILIEDDLDGYFEKMTAEEQEDYKKKIIHNVHIRLEKSIPVFLLYASPEIESWFVADWNNGFGYLYKEGIPVDDVEAKAKAFFVHHLKLYIQKNILKQYANDVESYGYFDGIYYKLSDCVKDAVQTGVKEYIQSLLPDTNKEFVRQIVQSKYLYYSKKEHGGIMLRKLEPQMVAYQCRTYFRPVYNELSDFSS